MRVDSMPRDEIVGAPGEGSSLAELRLAERLKESQGNASERSSLGEFLLAERLEEAETKAGRNDRRAAKEKKTIILFGQSGDGKSTIGNMLVNGSLEGPFTICNAIAQPSNPARPQEEEGSSDRWTVVEAPGFLGGNSRYEHTEYLRERAKEGKAVCICYVKKSGQFSLNDEQCWRVFRKTFGKQAAKVLLVFTNASDDWVSANRSGINSIYGNQYPCVAVDFPPVDTAAKGVESARAVQRLCSRERLEAELEKFYEA